MKKAKTQKSRRLLANNRQRAARAAFEAVASKFCERLGGVIMERAFPQVKIAALQVENDRLRTALQAIAGVCPDNTSSMCWVVKVAEDALIGQNA